MAVSNHANGLETAASDSPWRELHTPLRLNTYWKNETTNEIAWSRPNEPEPEPPGTSNEVSLLQSLQPSIDYAMPVSLKGLRSKRYNCQAGVVVDFDNSKGYLRMPKALGGGVVSVSANKLCHLIENTNVWYAPKSHTNSQASSLWQVDSYDEDSNTYTIRDGGTKVTCVVPIELEPASAIPGIVTAFSNSDQEEPLEFTDSLGQRHMFSLRFPKMASSKVKHPLLVYLHGQSSAHRSFYGLVSKQQRHRLPPGLNFVHEHMIVASPDCLWSWQDSPAPWVAELVRVLSTATYVDPRRVYLLGLSMGGMGTWEIAADNPNLFAAIAPVAAHHKRDRRRELAAALKHMPIWTAHCRHDNTCPLSDEEELWQVIESQSRPRCAPFERRVLEQGSHGTACSVFMDSAELYEWFLRFDQSDPR